MKERICKHEPERWPCVCWIEKVNALKAELERVKVDNQTIAKAYKDLVANIERVDAEEESKLEIAREALVDIRDRVQVVSGLEPHEIDVLRIAKDALSRMEGN